MLNLLGGYNPRVSALTFNLCSFSGQLLWSLHVAPNSLTAFSYEGTLFALKTCSRMVYFTNWLRRSASSAKFPAVYSYTTASTTQYTFVV